MLKWKISLLKFPTKYNVWLLAQAYALTYKWLLVIFGLGVSLDLRLANFLSQPIFFKIYAKNHEKYPPSKKKKNSY